jgi:hypothetical protein
MKKLVSIALCSFAAAAFALPAAAADEAGAKNRAGANASVEGGAALGGTGVNAQSPSQSNNEQPRSGDNAGAGRRTGDAQARNDNKTEDSVQAPGSERKAKPKSRAQRKDERDASSGTSGKTY